MREDEWPLTPDLPGLGGLSGPSPTLSDVLSRRLFEQRVVLLHGPLDDLSVTRASAELMTLDADGDDPVTLRVDCGEGGLAHALTLMDVVELMGVPVRALCLGQVGEGAVGVVAVCATARGAPEHPLHAAGARERSGGARARAQRGPVGRAASRRAGPLLRTGRGRDRACRRRAA